MLNVALNYRSLNLSVIPLRPRGKEPLIPWIEFQSRLASEDEIKQWFLKWPNLNLGIVTGALSGVAVVDLDGPEGLQSVKSLGITSSVISISGKGKHLWYRVPNGITLIANTVRQHPGLDVRGEGGYVVAPPSLHENGNRYRWTSPFRRSILPEFPSVLLSPNKATLTPLSIGSQETHTRKPPLDVKSLLEGMTNGNIDNSLFLICSKLRGDNWSSDDARILLEPHAIRAGATPGHLDDKIENVWTRYEPRPAASSEASGRSRVYESAERSSLTIHSPNNANSWDQFKQRNDLGTVSGLRTGYSKLDEMLKGGLKSSRLFTVAARTGTGKTNWLLGAAREICLSGKKVLLFSTEMPYADVWNRYIATLDDPKSFNSHKFFVCDSFAPSIERVEEAIKEIKPDVFIFDHINHVSEEQRELGSFMQGLNFIRRKYDCAGIVAAQLNRSADWVDLKTGERITPRMSMVKGSGTIEQASSRVLLLSESRVGPEGSEIVGNLDKNDNGPKGLLFFQMRNNPYKMVGL